MKGGIRSYLLADSAILAACPRVYSFPAPNNAAKPYMILSRVSSQIQNLIGSSLDIYDESWQIDVIASTDAAAEAIKELVVTRMNIADRVEMGSYTVYSCSLAAVRDLSELEMDGGQTADIRISLEFSMIRDREATPVVPPPEEE